MDNAYVCPVDLEELILTLPDIDRLYYDRPRCGGRAGAKLKKLRDRILIDHDPEKYKHPFTGWNLNVKPTITPERDRAAYELPIAVIVKWVLAHPREFGKGAFNFMLFHFARWGFITEQQHIDLKRID